VIDISMILPTRERPALARRMLDSVFATADHPAGLEVVLYVDRDDTLSHGIDHAGLKLVRLLGPRAKMGAMTQACYAASHGRVIMLVNDDQVFRTAGWDTEILTTFARFPDDVALLWGNDLCRGASFPTHPVLSRTVCEIMGGVCPRAYRRDYIDTHIYDVFCTLRRLGHDRLIHLSHVVFEHLQVDVGKAEMDNTSIKLSKADDEITYIAWADERRLAAARLFRHIDSASGSLRNRAALRAG
jgi:hypothetical protein